MSQISQRQAEIDLIRNDFATLDEVQERFEEVKKFGFFSDQNRFDVQRSIRQLKEQSGVISAKFEIKPLEVLENEDLKKVGHDLVKSEIVLNVESFDDIDAFRFLYYLNYGFPGQVVIDRLEMRRALEVTQPLLRSIGNGEEVPIVNTTIKFDWFTIKKDEDFEGAPQ